MPAGLLYYSISLKSIIIPDLSSYLVSTAIICKIPSFYFSNSGKGKRERGTVVSELGSGSLNYILVFSAAGFFVILSAICFFSNKNLRFLGKSAE